MANMYLESLTPGIYKQNKLLIEFRQYVCMKTLVLLLRQSFDPFKFYLLCRMGTHSISSVIYIFNIRLRSKVISAEQRVVLKIKGNDVLLMSEKRNTWGTIIFYIIINLFNSLFIFAQPTFVN